MSIEHAPATDRVGASYQPPPDMQKEQASAHGVYRAWFVDGDGRDLWAILARARLLLDGEQFANLRAALIADALSPLDRHLIWQINRDLVRENVPVRVECIHNVVTTVGKNLALDTYLAGIAYTVTGPYLGLISSTTFSAVAATDTMSAHGGWLEAGSANLPHYSGTRPTAAFNSAASGSKSLTSALSYAITASGTVKGGFLVFGPGASSTIDNTGGTLYSAGLFTGGDQPVTTSGTLNVTFTASL